MKKNILLPLIILFTPLTVHASFIEATMGAAVVNDATAIYFNPAAMVLIKNPQLIGLATSGHVSSHFAGEILQPGFNQSGSSNSHTHYFVPSFYAAYPVTNQMTLGFSVISNFFNRDVGDNSILRYVQAGNNLKDIDLIPAISWKVNPYLSFGANLNFSHASFVSQPISGLPAFNIPDSQTRNESNANGWGGDIGVLVKPSDTTLLGLNYRSAIAYHFSGKSILETNPQVVSSDYSFKFFTPARYVISISQFLTKQFAMIATAQRIEWDIFREVTIHGIATRRGIINADVPWHLRNTWLLTIGGNYRFTKDWVVRMAVSYNQSPDNPSYQIANGNSYIAGLSSGYTINQYFVIDGSYAHVFMQNRNIHTTIGRSTINGVNQGAADVLSLKLTVNFA